jgi:hypothetical protein
MVLALNPYRKRPLLAKWSEKNNLMLTKFSARLINYLIGEPVHVSLSQVGQQPEPYQNPKPKN